MRVHGVEGVRVVDASAMPYVTNGNIYAPVMMLAEKAADLILGNTPLAPEPVDFYRHDQPVDRPHAVRTSMTAYGPYPDRDPIRLIERCSTMRARSHEWTWSSR